MRHNIWLPEPLERDLARCAELIERRGGTPPSLSRLAQNAIITLRIRLEEEEREQRAALAAWGDRDVPAL